MSKHLQTVVLLTTSSSSSYSSQLLSSHTLYSLTESTCSLTPDKLAAAEQTCVAETFTNHPLSSSSSRSSYTLRILSAPSACPALEKHRASSAALTATDRNSVVSSVQWMDPLIGGGGRWTLMLCPPAEAGTRSSRSLTDRWTSPSRGRWRSGRLQGKKLCRTWTTEG